MATSKAAEIASLRLELHIARMRARSIHFAYKVPQEFIRNRTRAAYDSGYEAGWRGWAYDNPYSTTHHSSAYRHGYADANANLHNEALQIAAPPVAERPSHD